MGNAVSRGTLDVISILFPFVLSAGLIIMIVICWWKCKRLVERRRPEKAARRKLADLEEAAFGHLINIQEYAENQVGTTIVYAESPGSSYPHPYVYFSDGRITRIVPLSPSPTFSNLQQDHSLCPSALLCSNLSRSRNNNSNTVGHLNDINHDRVPNPANPNPNHSQPEPDLDNTVTTLDTKQTEVEPETASNSNMQEKKELITDREDCEIGSDPNIHCSSDKSQSKDKGQTRQTEI